MLCPKCYGKVKKEQVRCPNCGFNLNLMQGASNKQAKKAKKSIYKDDILYTTQIPPDVSKKKLLLFSIFLGLFGVHNFYVGKFWQGLYMCVCTGLTTILSILIPGLGIVNQDNVLYITFQFLLIFQGINIILWVYNIFSIIFERYKIPVYKDEFSTKK